MLPLCLSTVLWEYQSLLFYFTHVSFTYGLNTGTTVGSRQERVSVAAGVPGPHTVSLAHSDWQVHGKCGTKKLQTRPGPVY